MDISIRATVTVTHIGVDSAERRNQLLLIASTIPFRGLCGNVTAHRPVPGILMTNRREAVSASALASSHAPRMRRGGIRANLDALLALPSVIGRHSKICGRDSCRVSAAGYERNANLVVEQAFANGDKVRLAQLPEELIRNRMSLLRLAKTRRRQRRVRVERFRSCSWRTRGQSNAGLSTPMQGREGMQPETLCQRHRGDNEAPRFTQTALTDRHATLLDGAAGLPVSRLTRA